MITRSLWKSLLLLVLMMVVLWAEMQLFSISPPRPQPMMLPPEYVGSSNEESARPIAGEPNIFFIEPTCAFEEDTWEGLSARQTCAVESAVLHNPDSKVYVLHTCAPPSTSTYVPKGARAVYAPTDFFFGDNELESSILQLSGFFGTEYSVQHAQQILALVTLWKYGGVYLSMDYIVLKRLLELGEDWSVAEDPQRVSARALSLSAVPLSPGQQVATELVQRLHEAGGAADGAAALLTDVLRDRCGFDQTDNIDDCDGFQLLPGELMLPVLPEMWEHLFWTDYAQDTLNLIQGAYGVCSFEEKNEDFDPTASSAYGVLAKDNCPVIYERGFTRSEAA